MSHESDDEPILMGEVPAPGASARPARKSAGGLLTVLGLLIPVALGGATVFGVYFLFLKDLLDQPAPPENVEQPGSTANEPPATKQNLPSESRPPVNVNPPPAVSDSDAPPSDHSPRDSVKTPAETQGERETAARKALGLARQMSARNPSAAGKWYRKVLEDFPGTGAAAEAQDWLKKQAGGP